MSTSTVVETEEGVVDAPTFGDAIKNYWIRVRGGEVGSMPAILGLVVLVLLFTAMRPNTFTTALNFANLIQQGAAITVIAMGLVFVLLLGEIDLAAGFTAGTSGCVMGIMLNDHGWPWWLAILAALVTGTIIGSLIGLLVSRVGIPSFVVTLAFFLSLQGIMLALIGEGGTVPINDPTILAIENKNLPIWAGWALYVLGMALYGWSSFRKYQRGRRSGIGTTAFSVWITKFVLLALLLGWAVWYLSGERAINPHIASLKGVPQVVVVLAVFAVCLTFLLTRTSFGRHVYAVGGNSEAARRAGINVANLKLICFMIESALAGAAGVLLASRNNSISPTTGSGNTLLLAVAAAVIGGTSLFGGRGRIVDAVIGGIVVAVIQNGMLLLNLAQAWVYFFTGLVLLLAASVDALSRRRAAAG